MKMKRTASILLVTLLVLTGCKDNSSYTPESGLNENHPIEFGVSGSLSVESKAPITSGADFIAFGDLTVGESDPVPVFGDEEQEGQEVKFIDDDQNLDDDQNPHYTYSPMRYWQLGSYSFGGVMPDGNFYTATFSSSDQKITLDFGEEVVEGEEGSETKTKGYNLAEHQADLMAAFHTVNVQSLSDPATVHFEFAHQLSWVVIQAASQNSGLSDDGLQISKLKVYGNSPSTKGDIVFTNTADGVAITYELSDKTTAEHPYKTYNKSWTLVKPNANSLVYVDLVPQLLVFPEACTFAIEVTYTENGIEKTRTGSLKADWAAGKKYTYKLHIATDISFSVSVTGWGDQEVPDGDEDADNDVEIY
jgi:hypothetical protein